MAKLSCFSLFAGRKKNVRIVEEQHNRVLQASLEHPVQPSKTGELKSETFSVSIPSGIEEDSQCNVEVVDNEVPCLVDPTDMAYEGEDEHEEPRLIKRELSGFDFQSQANLGKEESHRSERKMTSAVHPDTDVGTLEIKAEQFAEGDCDMIQSGHVSDPGIRKVEFWASPMLKRSCSGIETREVLGKISDQLPPLKSFQSFEDLQELPHGVKEDVNLGSPVSVASHVSADNVMLRKHSSSQVLPSRSRRLWWKLFLWSHRNTHEPQTRKPLQLPALAVINQQGGYSSDTVEPNTALKFGKIESPGSFTGKSTSQVEYGDRKDIIGWDGLRGSSSLWPQKQWVAFPSESSSFYRVDEWMKDVCIDHPIAGDCSEQNDEGAFNPVPTGTVKAHTGTPAHLHRHQDINVSREMLHANAVIQSLNSSSTVAHITGMGLKVVPAMSLFSSLKSVNLSGNYIVHIPPGSLPKTLHVLNLSKNKINAIDGLRELIRLRVLDLSYNRISKIGHGLSNCTHIKVLYLAGNKISDVEGLHRLLKLTVLDLSFNKITTTKALGQLVANYSSLQALNLLGNPIQSNINDDQLRKAVCSFLPKLIYLNKQPVKQQRARDVLTDSVAKAALGSDSRGSHRKAAKRTSQSGSQSSRVHKIGADASRKSKNKSKLLVHHHSDRKNASSLNVSSSR